jgi:hypothetical protein
MTQWWLTRDEAVYGPYPIEQLQEMLSQDEIAENDQFCPVGTEKRCQAYTFHFKAHLCGYPTSAV